MRPPEVVLSPLPIALLEEGYPLVIQKPVEEYESPKTTMYLVPLLEADEEDLAPLLEVEEEALAPLLEVDEDDAAALLEDDAAAAVVWATTAVVLERAAVVCVAFATDEAFAVVEVAAAAATDDLERALHAAASARPKAGLSAAARARIRLKDLMVMAGG